MYRTCVAIIMGGTPSLISEKVMDLKDKLKLFQRIRNDKYAETDLQLLKAKWPSYLFIPRFERDPKRYAYDIQYALLDVVQVEEIIKNRTLADGSSEATTTEETSIDAPTAKKTSSKTPTAKKTSSKTPTKKTSSKTSAKKQNKNKTKSATSEKEENTDDGSSKTLTDGEVPADSSLEVPSDTSSETSSETSTEEESSKKK